MLLQYLVPSSIESALRYASSHWQKDMLPGWVPAKAWKVFSERSEFPQDASNPLNTSSSYATPESNGRCKRRKLQRKSAIVFPVEPETDEAPTNTFKSGHTKTDIVSGIDDSVQSSIISGEKCEEGIGSECHSDELVIGEDTQIRELCISVLRSHGLLVGDWCKSTSVPTKILRNNKGCDSFQSCELCCNLDNTLNMLLCDHCEKAFHASCCNPKTKMLPTEPHTSRVRIGGCFQATVPEWSDQISKDFDSIGEPLVLDLAETVGLHGCPTDKYLGSISNWLQCQEVLYDGTGEYAEGTIRGKWHRAPISEVQTDDWDCSCSVLWDPSNSDCAVPQELETSEVLLQLKYIEQLKSRLATKKIDFRS